MVMYIVMSNPTQLGTTALTKLFLTDKMYNVHHKNFFYRFNVNGFYNYFFSMKEVTFRRTIQQPIPMAIGNDNGRVNTKGNTKLVVPIVITTITCHQPQSTYMSMSIMTTEQHESNKKEEEYTLPLRMPNTEGKAIQMNGYSYKIINNKIIIVVPLINDENGKITQPERPSKGGVVQNFTTNPFKGSNIGMCHSLDVDGKEYHNPMFLSVNVYRWMTFGSQEYESLEAVREEAKERKAKYRKG